MRKSQQIRLLEDKIKQYEHSILVLRRQADEAAADKDKLVLDKMDEINAHEETKQELTRASDKITELENRIRKLNTSRGTTKRKAGE